MDIESIEIVDGLPVCRTEEGNLPISFTYLEQLNRTLESVARIFESTAVSASFEHTLKLAVMEVICVGKRTRSATDGILSARKNFKKEKENGA